MCEYQHLQGADPQHLLQSSDTGMINDAAGVHGKRRWRMEAVLLHARLSQSMSRIGGGGRRHRNTRSDHVVNPENVV